MKIKAKFLPLVFLLVAVMSLAPSAKAETFNLAGLYTRIATFTVNPSTAETGNANCNFGDTVLDAGYHISTDQFFTHAVSSFPTSRPTIGQPPGRSWSVQVYNGGIAPVTVTITAICAPRGAFGTAGIVVARSSGTVSNLSFRYFTVACPSGYKSVAGGYEQSRSGIDPFVDRSYAPTPTQWQVQYEAPGEGTNVTTWAICAPAAAPISLKTARFTFGTFDNIAREGSATCDSGQKTLGGSYFLSSRSQFRVNRSYPSRSDTWTVRLTKPFAFISTDVILSAFCFPRSSTIGLAEAAQEQQTVPAGAPVGYTLHYEVPEPMIWQDLQAQELWLRAAEDGQPVLGVRFDEAANTLCLWDEVAEDFIQCAPVGGEGELVSEIGALDLERSLWWEEEPAGRGLGLRLVLRLAPELAGRTLLAEVVAHTDDGRSQSFEVGKLMLGAEDGDTTEAALAQLDHLIEATEHAGAGKSLNRKAKGIKKGVESADAPLTCHRLQSFVSEVHAMEGRGLTSDQATHFQADVNTLPDLLGCE